MRALPRLVVASLCTAGALAPGAAAAGPLLVNDNGVTRSIACGPSLRVVRVTGNQATLTITGRCTSVSLIGNGAKVTLQRATSLKVSGSTARVTAGTVDRIDVSGSSSRVSYRASSTGRAAKVSASGSGARVTRRG